MERQALFTDWQDQHHVSQQYYDRLWARLSVGLHQQAARRAARAQGKDIEANVIRAAGSFKGFQHQLKRENGRLFAETVKLKAYHLEQVKALPAGREVKLLVAGPSRLKRTVLDEYLRQRERVRLEAQDMLNRTCARQAAYYQRRENWSSSQRWGDMLNPFKWIDAFRR